MSVDHISTISVEATSEAYEMEQDNRQLNSRLNSKDIYCSFFRIIAILFLFSLLGAPIFLIPRHNTIFYPEYWYEMYLCIVFVSPISAMNLLLNCSVFTQQPTLTSTRLIWKITTWIVLNYSILWSICYSVWVLYLEKNHPMPFNGLVKLPVWIALLCGIWILFPTELLSVEDFREKLRTQMLYSMWWFVMSVQKDILSILFKNTPLYLEWLFAFVVPCFREMNKRVLTKLVHRMAGSDNEAANVLLVMNVNVHYALFIAIRLSGSHISTVCCMLAIDFILHLKTAHNLIQNQRKVTVDLRENEQKRRIKNKAILKLVLAEMCEGMVPLAYVILFSIVHYGPNSAILERSIGDNTINGHVGKIYGVMFLLFALDTISCLTNAYLLWTFGKINITQTFCKVVEKYWHFMLIQLCQNLYSVIHGKDINNGMDWSLKLPWITDEGRSMLIYNSPDLAEMEKNALLFNETLE